MKIPFFPNTADGTHCFQAALKMALAVLMPGRSFTYDELDEISTKLPGKWTWPTAAMIWMMEQGLDVRLVEDFDYEKFAERGGDYLLERYGEEVGRAQMAHSDVERERPLARRFADLCRIDRRPAEIKDLADHIAAGFVVIVNLNAAALYSKPGYSGHFVVVCEAGPDFVVLHDPGLPPRESLKVSADTFFSAWAYPSTRDRNLLAIGKPEASRAGLR